MTQWGMLLLCVFIAVGASGRLTSRKAGRVVLIVTVAIIAGAIITYAHTTPTDKYYRDVDATIYATGDPYGASATTGTDVNPAAAEDTTGVQPATYGDTVNATPGG